MRAMALSILVLAICVLDAAYTTKFGAGYQGHEIVVALFSLSVGALAVALVVEGGR